MAAIGVSRDVSRELTRVAPRAASAAKRRSQSFLFCFVLFFS